MTPRGKRISTAAAIATALAIPAEGLRQVAYYDPPGILTVCYGHTGPDVDPKRLYPIEECKRLITKDMLDAINQVDRCVPNLPENVLAAFGDATFNIGSRIACDTTNSTAARYLAAGQYGLACAQLPRWDKARIAGVLMPLPGLTKRRMAEYRLCIWGLT